MPPLDWRAKSSARSKRSSPSSTESPGEPDEPDPPKPPTEDPTAAWLMTMVKTMREQGARAAQAIGVSPSTLRRWRARDASGEPVSRRRGGRRKPVTVETSTAVRSLVRTLHGLVGASSLSHSVAGVSRRQAQEIKQHELRAMEQERRDGCSHVEVTEPGIMRGFDAMHMTVNDQRRFLLVAADASVPYRTSAAIASTYDGTSVAAALADDFGRHGAPLVCRLDRASCHQTAEVVSVLAAFGVLALHGPPHHPCFYGQLERQNREHRAWLAGAEYADEDHLADVRDQMLHALNAKWARRTLCWRTSASVWEARRPVSDNRVELREEVEARAAHLRTEHVEATLAWRLAIERALVRRGHLTINTAADAT
jgi:hypothetical protein